jgi:hypothetical protein
VTAVGLGLQEVVAVVVMREGGWEGMGAVAVGVDKAVVVAESQGREVTLTMWWLVLSWHNC